MAEIICTIKEFHKFFGPRIRNLIQTMTKKRKREINYICQMCKEKNELEASHIKGKDRKTIVEKLLEKYIVDKNKKIVRVNLEKFEVELKKSHKPVDKYFKFLCPQCHYRYDNSR